MSDRFCMKGLPCIIFVLLSCSFAGQLSAQEIKVRSGFIPDSVLVGDQSDYYLTATYPRKLTLLFPDSTFNFQPFEFEKKKYFTTQTSDSISYDSAVYTLSTFEIEKIQYLQLPVFVLHQQDCTTVFATRDSVMLKELVTIPLPDSLRAENLPLKINAAYEPVNWLLNYPLLLYVLLGVVIVGILVWVLFGKRIRKHYKIKRLKKEHQFFIEALGKKIALLKNTFSPQQTEETLAIWKKYMETLDSKPYTKLTTRETATLLNNPALGNHLRTLDAAVYGNQSVVVEPLENLRAHAVNSFQQKLDKVQHG
jgi:hypothetical protein